MGSPCCPHVLTSLCPPPPPFSPPQLKIWFSERDLERTFSYPSEGALLAAWGPPPEEPQTPPPGPPTAPDEDEEEEEPPPGRGLQGGLRARALLVGEWRGPGGGGVLGYSGGGPGGIWVSWGGPGIFWGGGLEGAQGTFAGLRGSGGVPKQF